ncbi:MAG: pilus assembly protein [Firmicutes bacterium]|nr:pilus assembly protein [Bacillota bacterium]
MKVLDKKGQSLTAFVLILPILLMLFALIIDTGSLYLEKKKLEDGVLTGLKYGMKHKDTDVKDKMRLLVRENVDGVTQLDIYTSDNQIKILAKKKKNTLLMGNIINQPSEMKVIYTAYFENQKWRIVKERG